jgi:hypothetical protein
MAFIAPLISLVAAAGRSDGVTSGPLKLVTDPLLRFACDVLIAMLLVLFLGL